MLCFSKENGEIVLPQDMRKCQVYAGRKICFEPEEVTQMKAFDSSGLEFCVLCFLMTECTVMIYLAFILCSRY